MHKKLKQSWKKSILCTFLMVIMLISSSLPAYAGVGDGGPAGGGISSPDSDVTYTPQIGGIRISIGTCPAGEYLQGYLITNNIVPISQGLSGGFVFSLTATAGAQHHKNVAKGWYANSGNIMGADNNYVESNIVKGMHLSVPVPGATITEAKAFDTVAKVLEYQPFNGVNDYIMGCLKNGGFTNLEEKHPGAKLTDTEAANNTMIFRAFAEVIYQYGGQKVGSPADLIRKGTVNLNTHDFYLVTEPVGVINNKANPDASKQEFMVSAYAGLSLYGRTSTANKYPSHHVIWSESRQSVYSTSGSPLSWVKKQFIGNDSSIGMDGGFVERSPDVKYLASTMWYTGPKSINGVLASYSDEFWGWGTVYTTLGNDGGTVVNLYIDEDNEKVGADTDPFPSDRKPNITNKRTYGGIEYTLIETWATKDSIKEPLTDVKYPEITGKTDKDPYTPGVPSPNKVPDDKNYVYNVYKATLPGIVVEIILDNSNNFKTISVYDMPASGVVADKSSSSLELVSSHQTKKRILQPPTNTRKNHIDSYGDKRGYTLGTAIDSDMKNAYIVYKEGPPPPVPGDVVLHQNQIAKKYVGFVLRKNASGTRLYDVKENHPSWVASVGTHSSNYYSGCYDYECEHSDDDGGSWSHTVHVHGSLETSYCWLAYLTDPDYHISYWGDSSAYNLNILAAKNSATGFGYGLYVNHNDNKTGGRQYSLGYWNPAPLSPTIDFVIYRGQNRPTIASYKHPTPPAILTNSEGFGLTSAKTPTAVSKDSDYNETLTFSLKQMTMRGYINNSQSYGADDLKVEADCNTLVGCYGGHPVYAGHHIGTMGTNTYTTNINVLVKVFSGKNHKTASARGADNVATPNLTMASRVIKTLKQGKAQNILNLTSFEYYPYLNMTYETLTQAKADIFVLSKYKSTITPSNYIEFGVTSGMDGATNGQDTVGNGAIDLTSQMFSTHATARGQIFYGANNVLAGGAVYQLKNVADKNKLPRMGLTTYQWYVENPSHLAAVTGSAGTAGLTKDAVQKAKHKSAVDEIIAGVKNVNSGIRMYIIGQSTYNASGLTGLKYWDGTEVKKSQSITVGGRNLTTSRDDKYYLTPDQAKLEIFNAAGSKGLYDEVVTTYLIKSNTKGDVEILKNGAVVSTFARGQSDTSIISSLNQEWKLLDDKTKLVTNYLAVTYRNMGETPEPSSTHPFSEWWNEAFDGIGIIKIETAFSVGINEEAPNPKTLAVDPQLEPAQASKADMYKTYYKWGWTINKSAPDLKFKFDTIEYNWGNLSDLLKLRTRDIYLPNASVTDLG